MADEILALAPIQSRELDETLGARAMEFKAEIEARLASGPPTPMDFAALKARLRFAREGQEEAESD